MKPLTCEMCGSTNLLKQDGVFVCQSCGTKYSVEEAKKMMVEGTVEVKGTVKIDKTADLGNLIHLCESALDANNNNEALSFANRILEADSSSFKGWFLKLKAVAGLGNLYDLRCMEVISVGNEAISHTNSDEDKLSVYNFWLFCARGMMQFCINNIFDENYHNNCLDIYYSNKEAFGTEYAQQQCIANDEILNLINNQLQSLVALRLAVPHDIVATNEELTEGVKAVALTWSDLQDALTLKYNDYEMMLGEGAIQFFGSMHDEIVRGLPKSSLEEIQKIEEEKIQNAEIPESKNGCYVATAVYGSYDCPEVWTLRRFRDYTLAETWYGRAFIRTYYAVSPSLVKWFGDRIWFRALWLKPLNSLVSFLNHKGVEDSPYIDKY